VPKGCLGLVQGKSRNTFNLTSLKKLPHSVPKGKVFDLENYRKGKFFWPDAWAFGTECGKSIKLYLRVKT
jgi:hypothetical protein